MTGFGNGVSAVLCSSVLCSFPFFMLVFGANCSSSSVLNIAISHLIRSRLGALHCLLAVCNAEVNSCVVYTGSLSKGEFLAACCRCLHATRSRQWGFYSTVLDIVLVTSVWCHRSSCAVRCRCWLVAHCITEASYTV